MGKGTGSVIVEGPQEKPIFRKPQTTHTRTHSTAVDAIPLPRAERTDGDRRDSPRARGDVGLTELGVCSTDRGPERMDLHR